MEVNLRFEIGFNVVSADFFEENEDKEMEYYASMRSNIKKTGNIWTATNPRFILDWEFESTAAGSLELHATDAKTFEVSCVIPDEYGVEYTGEVKWESEFFRKLHIEVDKLKGLSWPPEFATTDIPQDEQPADILNQDINIASVLGTAGLKAEVKKSNASLPWDYSNRSGREWEDRWDERELHEIMADYYSGDQKDRKWWLYLLIANRFDGGPLIDDSGNILLDENNFLINAGTGVFGIMFDYRTGDIKDPWAMFHEWLSAFNSDIKSYFNLEGVMRSGAFDNLRARQGAAVFADAIKDEALIDADWHRNRALIRTMVHELGHALNLPHPFECDHYDSVSIMNYPSVFPEGSDYIECSMNYWRKFYYAFDPNEIYHLHHGFFNEVVPGGLMEYAEWTPSSGFHSTFNPNTLSVNLALDIMPTKRIFRFTEPVTFEITATNLSNKSIPLGSLSPAYGNVRFVIKSPNGIIRHYRPPLYKSEIPRGRLEAKESKKHLTSLAVGAQGFVFDAPGRYDIFAVTPDLSSGDLAISRVESLMVLYPDGPETDIANRIFDRQAALFLYMGGGEHLNGGKSLLEDVADRYKQHPIVAHANLVLGLNKYSGQKHATTGRVTKADRKNALKFLQAALDSKVLSVACIERLIDTIDLCKGGWESTDIGPKRVQPS
jgi:hypothetical protein